MADRFFPNEMPDYIPETPAEQSAAVAASDSLTKLLHRPFKTLSEGLKKAALDLKDTVALDSVPFYHVPDAVFLFTLFS